MGSVYDVFKRTGGKNAEVVAETKADAGFQKDRRRMIRTRLRRKCRTP